MIINYENQVYKID